MFFVFTCIKVWVGSYIAGVMTWTHIGLVVCVGVVSEMSSLFHTVSILLC